MNIYNGHNNQQFQQMNPTNKLQETTRHVLSHETCLNSEAKEFVTRNEICTKADNEEPCFTRVRVILIIVLVIQ